MERLTDKRLATPPGQWQEVTHEEARELKEIPVPSMRELYYRLSQIEDILGDEYNLDRLRELARADREGRCVVFQPGYAVVSIYNPADKDGLYTMSATGVITKEEYEAALRREQE